MHFFTTVTLLSSAALSTAQYAFARAALGEYKAIDPPVHPVKRQFAATGTAGTAGSNGGFATGALQTNPTGFNPTGGAGAVATNIVYTTQLIVTDCGNGTMIYIPAVTAAPVPGQSQGQRYANVTSATFIPAQPSVEDPLPPYTTPTNVGAGAGAGAGAAAPTGMSTSVQSGADAASSNAASTPEPFAGSASRHAPSSLTPYVSTIAGLALFALVV